MKVRERDVGTGAVLSLSGTVRKMNVLCAVSGGVDSTVATALALDAARGHGPAATMIPAGSTVTAVTMLLWGGDRRSRSCSTADATAAERAAAELGVEHVVIDHRTDFDDQVIAPFRAAAAEGVTKNPCIDCNRQFKLEALTTYARRHGFDVIVTGHHARVVDTGAGRRLARGRDLGKDQSYVLAPADSNHLTMLRLPVGECTKDDVRTTAAALGLSVADQPDSMDLCFDPRAVVPGTPADVVVDGQVRTPTKPVTVEHLTVGQRVGVEGSSKKLFVAALDAAGRQVHLAPADEITVDTVTFSTWNTAAAVAPGTRVWAQFSAHGTPHAATFVDDAAPGVRLDVPARRPAPGQVTVCYSDPGPDAFVLGWGVNAA